MEQEKKETDPTPDERMSKMAAENGRLKIEALAQSAGAADAKAVADVVARFAKPSIDMTGTVKIAMVDPETGEKLRTASGEEMTPGQFITQMKSDPDHGYLFKDGAAGKPKAMVSGGLSTETNPWHRDTFNLTEQARLSKSDPEYAARLRDAAKGTLSDNPFSKEGFNLTRQAQILRENPALAERMKAEIAPPENPWLKSQENLTKQVLITRSDPTRAARLKAEAKLANGPDKPKSYIFNPPANAFRRRA